MIFFFGVLVIVFKGAPFLPSFRQSVAKMIEFADIQPGDKAVDLGSGEGRIVIALAKKGIEAHGYEINPVLVIWSWVNVVLSGTYGKAHIHWGNFWSKDLSQFTIVTLFGLTKIMPELEKKLSGELKPGARVVSNVFTFPGWTPSDKEGEIFKYTII